MMVHPCDSCEFGPMLAEAESTMLDLVEMLETNSNATWDRSNIGLVPDPPDDPSELAAKSQEIEEGAARKNAHMMAIVDDARSLVESSLAQTDTIDCATKNCGLPSDCPKLTAIFEAHPPLIKKLIMLGMLPDPNTESDL